MKKKYWNKCGGCGGGVWSDNIAYELRTGFGHFYNYNGYQFASSPNCILAIFSGSIM